MKVVKINKVNDIISLRVYKDVLIENINKYRDTKAMKELCNMYDFDSIISSVDSIYLSGEYICIPSNSTILKYLQYGGKGIKALNLLSLSYMNMGGGLL